MAEVGQIFEYLNELAPVELKMDFDNVGLLVGNAEAKVEKCLVALDITVCFYCLGILNVFIFPIFPSVPSYHLKPLS